ncbi:MAG: proline--tRNA ligase [Deltaproteobacteria bacterium CG11_big_fil_rev_8_21_14_0_20_49_13]|nr:MAG: proline--tRNA ligase [Deltaproteobacteria bacterium CG11_big_fil_rev_8_21_14_0_20_49_13]
MRYSRSLIPTLREDPADAEVISHKLMIRGGYIRKVAAGIYDYLPLALRVFRKIETIVREEMDASGALELLLPIIMPAELWRESGRWDFYGKELLRIKDRADHDFCVGPTHEEAITDLARREIKSYRDLPKNLYQIQTKFRDEVRPRFGVMRGREFIMKDAYSFDVNVEASKKTYQVMYDTYKRIFKRCGLSFRPVEAVTGAIGGTLSHEFHVIASSGEDAIFFCDKCEYASNVEKTRLAKPNQLHKMNEELKDARAASKYVEVPTPGKKTIPEVALHLKVKSSELVKTLIYKIASEKNKSLFVAVLVRGDHEIVEAKLTNALFDLKLVDTRDIVLELAGENDVKALTGADVGFAGPIGIKTKVIADALVFGDEHFVVGANKTDAHLVGVAWADCNISGFADLRRARQGDKCPECSSGSLLEKRGIEVGQVFHLGTKYSEKMKAVYLDESGKDQFMVMGCYGIGISRTAAAAIEQNNDENGIKWPLPIAPYHVELIVMGADEKTKEVADKTYHELQEAGIEVLYDDRDERPGVKFADADLIGIPYHVVIGKKAIAEGKVELKIRKTGERKMVSLQEAADLIKNKLNDQ